MTCNVCEIYYTIYLEGGRNSDPTWLILLMMMMMIESPEVTLWWAEKSLVIEEREGNCYCCCANVIYTTLCDMTHIYLRTWYLSGYISFHLFGWVPIPTSQLWCDQLFVVTLGSDWSGAVTLPVTLITTLLLRWPEKYIRIVVVVVDCSVLIVRRVVVVRYVVVLFWVLPRVHIVGDGVCCYRWILLVLLNCDC